jgi:1,4-alpha-glucan branching enzyme
VLGTTAAGARVRFEVRRPTAGSVEILGDFTRWEPVAMARSDGLWIVELTVPAGTHHFGFLVDGIWFLPDDAPDAVADDWGRRNATLVVDSTDPEPGASPGPEGAAP